MRNLSLALLLALATVARGAEAIVTIDAAKPVAPVSPRLYGLMTEEINYSYDGGLYAELIRNRAFLDDAKTPVSWSVVQGGGAVASIAIDQAQPLNAKIPVSLRLEVKNAGNGARAGFANGGYWGIPVRPHTSYRASFHARSAATPSGDVTVSLESEDGAVTFASAKLSGVTTEWGQYGATLTTGDVQPTSKARLTVTVNQPGTTWFSFVSLFPPTWNNRPNGLRSDLMQMLVDMKPKFLRFPGGNYLEGNTVAERFIWRNTIGPVSERPGHRSPWGYRSTDGLGLLEFLEWCEDMGAEPVLAVYAGYSLEGEHVTAGPDLAPFVQEALEEIEYVTGDVNSTWGARRARDGHPAPFTLHYVEIGNEDGFDKSKTYDARFTQFFDAIKAKYPKLKCISTITKSDPPDKQVHSRTPDVFDEHYYNTVESFLKMGGGHYDKYDRAGAEIFVGEWAAYETAFPPWDKRSAGEPPTPNLLAALGDAAFMTNMERNSDVVVMHCYAPLLVNVNPGGRQWRPDMIGYDALRSFGSPSYHAFRMFSTHVGDQILRTTSADPDVFASATRRSKTGEIFVKLVNPTAAAKVVTITIASDAPIASTGDAVTLSATTPATTNSIDAPAVVTPVTGVLSNAGREFNYSIPANGIAVLTLRTRSAMDGTR